MRKQNVLNSSHAAKRRRGYIKKAEVARSLTQAHAHISACACIFWAPKIFLQQDRYSNESCGYDPALPDSRCVCWNVYLKPKYHAHPPIAKMIILYCRLFFNILLDVLETLETFVWMKNTIGADVGKNKQLDNIMPHAPLNRLDFMKTVFTINFIV
jgi:hypothetical protein